MATQDKLEIARLTLHYLISIQTSENATHALRRLEAEAEKGGNPDTFSALYRIIFKEIEASVLAESKEIQKPEE